MAALVIESFPEELHARLRQTAAAHQRSVGQETIYLLELALAESGAATPVPPNGYWSRRPLLPEYQAMLETNSFAGGTDSTDLISAERDAR